MVMTETSELDCRSVVENNPERDRPGRRAGRAFENPLQRAAAEKLEPVLEHQHAEQKDRNARRDFLRVGADPEGQQKRTDDDGKIIARHADGSVHHEAHGAARADGPGHGRQRMLADAIRSVFPATACRSLGVLQF